MQATEDMLAGYVEAALWSTLDYLGDTDESGNYSPLDARYGIEDIGAETLERMRSDCAEFAAANAADLDLYYDRLHYGPDQAGHDFWLTREGHGAGFWDRYYGTDTELRAAVLRLTDAAVAYGEFGDALNDGITERED
jgi:hypothetical protein